MGESNFAPLPWSRDEEGDIIDAAGDTVAMVMPNDDLVWEKTARLLLATPDLLECCKLAVAALGPVSAAEFIQKTIDKAA